MNLVEFYNGKKIGFYDVETNKWYAVSEMIIAKGRFQNIRIDNQIANTGFDYFLLPGFIDAHSHMFENPFIQEDCPAEADGVDYSEILQVASKNVRTACEAGITAIKDLGGRFFYSISVANYLNERGGSSRVYTSGCYFTSPGGHCSDRGGIVIDDIHDFIRGVDYLERHKIAFCKIIHGDDGFSQPFLKEMVEEAHKRKLLVSCHSFTEKAARDAVISGVDVLEHAGDYSEELLNQIKEKDIIVVPTFVSAYDGLCNSSVLSDVDSSVLQSWYQGETTVIPKLFGKGIKVALGTDSGLDGTHFNSLVREIKLIKHNFASISIEELFHSAFIITPQTIGMQNRLGKIQNGYLADFQVFDKNPIVNYEDTLGHPISVWVNGEEVFRRLDLEAVSFRVLDASDSAEIMKYINHHYFDCTLSGDFWKNDEIVSWFEASDDCCIGAFLSGEMIGFCLSHLHKEVHKVHIENIFVAEKYRDQGIGFRLLSEVMIRYKTVSQRLRYVGLVDVDNAGACRLLQKVGFDKGARFTWMQKNE